MQDWQIAVLNSENIRVDQDQYTGYRLVIRKTDEKNRMTIPTIVATVRKSKRKPVIMCPDEPFRGMFAEKKDVLDVLMSTPEYEEYTIWLAEAKMNGVIRMKGITPQTRINHWLVSNGYKPVEKDAEIHDCYLCLLHYRRLEGLLGDVSGRKNAIIRAIVEAENAPGVTERRIQGWVETIYGEVA
jgi:hypothetical protein